MHSIRRRLLLWLLSALVTAGGLAVIATWYKVRDEFSDMQDYHLQQYAYLLQQQSRFPGSASPFEGDGADLDFIGQIWGNGGVLRFSSHRSVPLPPLPAARLATMDWQGERYRVFSLTREGVTVQVAQSLKTREQALNAIALRLVAPLAAAVPLLALLIWVAVGRGLSPARQLAGEIARRSPVALEPLPVAPVPEEIRPMAEALNDLLARLQEALASQRRFVGDAAHELRSPLTALSLQLEILERARNDGERRQAVLRLRGGIERCVHLVQQLLTMARVDPDAPPGPAETVALGPLAREVIAQHAPLAESRHIDLGLAREVPVTVTGEREGLRTLLSNLVDNAVRYTPQGGRVDVSTGQAGADAVIEVMDNGPGIPAAERERVFDRFYRGAGPDSDGSGLGLAIVRRIADRHGATVSLSEGDGGRGLKVKVVLPQEVPPPGARRPGQAG